jgi:apolipoprotein N-acyltransferase
MKGLVLVVAGVLMAGSVARADDPGAKSFRGGGQDFRIEMKPSKTPNRMEVKFIEPTIEQRLDEVEKKLDRILKELEGKPKAGTAKSFDFQIWAF